MPLPLLALLAAMGATAGTGAAIGASRRQGQSRNPLDDDPNADVIDDGEQGLFPSVLEAIGRPGKIINNALVGNWEGAGRQLVDLGGDIVDAALPGDWIQHISRRKDKPEFSDVVGGMDPGIGKFATDVIGGAATDPTMLIPGAAVGKAAGAVGKVAGKAVGVADKFVPGAAKAVENSGRLLRSTFNAERVAPEVQKIIAAGDKGRLETDAVLGALKGGPVAQLTDDEAMIVTDILHNRHWNGDQMLGYLANPNTTAAQRIAMHPGVTAQNQAKIADAVQQAIDIGQTEAKYPGVFDQTGLPKEYMPRSWKGQTEEQALNEALGRVPDSMGGANATKPRSLLTPEDDLSFMEQNPGMTYERDARKLLAERGEQQGRLGTKAEIGKAIAGPGFTLVDDASKAKVDDFIKGLVQKGDIESAQVLQNHWNGTAPRGALTALLAKANTPFKRAAVAGFVVPKLGTDVRNRLAGIWQAASNPESRAAVPGMAKRFISDIAASVSDALGMKMGADRFSQILQDWEGALTSSGGSSQKAIATMRTMHPEAADLIESGVLDGYSRAEDLLNHWASSPGKKKLRSIADFPQRIMRGIEDRMRLGMGLDLVESGHNAADATRITGESLYKYGSGSAANRTARDFIPFFQFTAKAIPQQAKLLAEQPWVAGGLSRASEHDPDQPVYPWMEGKLNVPIGADEQGNENFISGFGLPFEALNMIPDASNDLGAFGRSVERDTIGASQPLVKTALGATFGEDPYFGSQFGAYDKVPFLGHAGAAGRAYNVAAGTGLLQPLDSPLRTIGKAFDGNRDLGTKALDLLTGANVVTVDPDLALRQKLEALLQQSPEVRQHTSYYGDDEDAPTQALLAEYAAAQHRLKAKRAAR